MIKIYNWGEIVEAKLDQLFLMQNNVKFGEMRIFNTTCTVAIVYPEYHCGIDIGDVRLFAKFKNEYPTWAEFDNYWQSIFSKYFIIALKNSN